MADLEDYVSAVEANIVKILGVAPQLDDTDKLAVSVHGKDSAPGDTPILVDPSGQLIVSLLADTFAGADGTSNWFYLPRNVAGNGLKLLVFPHFYNGSTWDRLRNNIESILLASAIRAATVNSSDQVNYNARGLLIFFSITVVPGVQTVTLTVTSKDSIAGTYEVLLTGGAEVGTGTKCYLIYPGAGAAANGIDVVNAFPVPRTWRVTVTHSGAGNFTYSVSAALIL